MRFRAVHKLMSYLLAAASVATLTTSGAVPTSTLLLLSTLGLLSWFVEPGTVDGQVARSGRAGVQRRRPGLLRPVAVPGVREFPRTRVRPDLERRVVPAGLQAVSPAQQPRLPVDLRPVLRAGAGRGLAGADGDVPGWLRRLRRPVDLDLDPVSPAARDRRQLPGQASARIGLREGDRGAGAQLAPRGGTILLPGDRVAGAGGVHRLGDDLRAGAAHRPGVLFRHLPAQGEHRRLLRRGHPGASRGDLGRQRHRGLVGPAAQPGSGGRRKATPQRHLELLLARLGLRHVPRRQVAAARHRRQQDWHLGDLLVRRRHHHLDQAPRGPDWPAPPDRREIPQDLRRTGDQRRRSVDAGRLRAG